MKTTHNDHQQIRNDNTENGQIRSDNNNFGMTSFLNTVADSRPHSASTSMNHRKHTWQYTRDRVSRFANSLAQLGVASEERVAVLALNSDRYTELYFSTWWAGAVIVPLNIRWSVEENLYSLGDSGAKILIVDDEFVPMAVSIKSSAEFQFQMIYIGNMTQAPEDFLHYEELIESALPAVDKNRCGDDIAGLYYTGGTTGFPKGVMLPHRALWYNSLVAAHHTNVGPEAVYLHVAPMFHLADGAAGNAISAVGGKHVYLPTFTAEGAIEVIESEQVTHATMVPTMIAMMLQSSSFNPEKLRSLKTLIYGASPMPEGVLREAISTLPNVDFIQGYGQTELSPLVTILPPDYHVLDGPKSTKLNSAGRPVIGCEIRIERDDGSECDYGEVGEVIVKSPGAMLGYWNLKDQTVDTLKEGWVSTGDVAYRDTDGFVFIVDRKKDMIVTGGENVFSAEVESAISTHPSVLDVAVIGIPSAQWGESVHAIVIQKTEEAISEEDVVAHCRDRIANYKLPRSVSFRTEPFPLSGAGKVLKRDLRAPFWENHDRDVN